MSRYVRVVGSWNDDLSLRVCDGYDDISHTLLACWLPCWQEATTKPAPPVPAAGAVRFEIKKWNAVAMWSWDICADTVRFILYYFFCD
jgi:hypothetical protein